MVGDNSVLHLSRSVLALAVNDENIIAVDSTPTIYYFSTSGEYINHLSISGLSSFYHRYEHDVTISPDGKILVICDGKNDKVICLNLNLKKIVANIKLLKSPNFTIFSQDSSCFMVANSVGRVGIYTTRNFSLLAEFALPDAVANAVFSQDCTKVAIATLDKKLHIFNIPNNSVLNGYKLDSIGQALWFSANDNEMTIFTRDGNAIIVNLKSEVIFNESPCYQWPTVIAHIPNSDIILLGTRSSQIFLYTSSKGAILGSVLLDSWGITSICIHNSIVMVGFSDGKITTLDMTTLIEEAYTYLNTGNFEKLAVLAASSPLIFIDVKLCNGIEEKYKEVFNYYPITEQEREGHEALVSLILSNNKKRLELLGFLYSSDLIVPFLEKVEKGEMEAACELASESPLLRQLREFREIKNNCFKNIVKQVKLLETNKQKFQEFTETMNSNCEKCFLGIISTPENLEQGYEQLKSSALSKNYPNLLDIVYKYPVLRQTRLYLRMMNFGEALIDKILQAMQPGNMQEALVFVEELLRLKPFEKTGLDFKQQIDQYGRFIKAVEEHNMELIFSIASDNPVLKITESFKKEMNTYKNLYKNLYIVAKQGDVAQIFILLHPYEKVSYFEDKNLQLYKLALISEILHYAKIGEEAEILQKYHQCFGWDEEYEKVCQAFEVEVNSNPKTEEISPECKAIKSFIVGEKIRRA